MVLETVGIETHVNKEVHMWSLLLTLCGWEREVDENDGEVLWVPYPVQ